MRPMCSQMKDSRPSFDQIAAPLLANPNVQRMDGFIQHGSVSTLDHCLRVSRTSLRLARGLHLHVDEKRLVEGALLHDFFLYDWHDRSTSMPHHATMHPVYAAKNARELLGADEAVQDIIRTHMWPLPPGRVPTSTEAWLVCVADKACSLHETLTMRRAHKQK